MHDRLIELELAKHSQYEQMNAFAGKEMDGRADVKSGER